MSGRARVTDVLDAVGSYLDLHGSLPQNCVAWGKATRGDERYPSWPTLRRAGFRSMEQIADALGTTVGGAHWGRQRVVEGLRQFVATHGALPGNSDTYLTLRRNVRRFPSSYAVFKFWPTFEAAAAEAGVPCTARCHDWTVDEEAFLTYFAGSCSRAELAEALARHTENAIKRRLYDLRLTCRTAQGLWTVERLARGLGCTGETVLWMARHGALRIQRISHFTYVDPGELPDSVVLSASDELRQAARRSRRLTLAALIADREVSLRSGRPIPRPRARPPLPPVETRDPSLFRWVGGVGFGPVEPTAIKLARLARQRSA